jgi:hypothetical protein
MKPMSKTNNVFISWSGERSKVAAQALKEWLPMVIQAVEPWMSDSDIDKGSRGLSEISNALGSIKIGIVCLTPENQDESWLNYEAGALSKTIDEKTRLCTYLLAGLTPEQVTQPLGMFQHARADKEDTRKLVHSINSAVSVEPLPEARLDSVFEMLWPSLEEKLSAIPAAVGKTKKRSVEEMVAELLDLARGDVSRRREDLEQVTAELMTQAARAELLRMKTALLQARLNVSQTKTKTQAPGAEKGAREFVVRLRDGSTLLVKADNFTEVGQGHYRFGSASGAVEDIQEVERVTEFKDPGSL